MQYTKRSMENQNSDAALYDSLGPVIRGVGMSLIELSVYRGKGRHASVQVKAVVYKGGSIGHEDCSRVHRAILPRLELAFPGQDLHLEVSSPGIDRLIKNGSEFVHYIGRTVKCYRTDISDWTSGVLCAVDEEMIVLRLEDGEVTLPYKVIAKARLDDKA